MLKNQTESFENADEFETKLNNAQEIHTSYVDAAIVKDGKAEFNLVNLHPGLDYKISAIRYIDKENKDQIPLAPMQKIALDSQVDFEKDASKKALFEATTAKIKLLAKSLIDQNLSSNQKRVSINFASLQNTTIIQNKPIQIVYKNLKTAQKFVASSIFAANLASFDLIGLEPGSSYQVESFILDATNIEFSPTFIKNFYTPAAIVDAKIALGASFANVELSVASADDLSGSEALLYLDDSSIIPATGVFQKTDQANIYKIKLTPSGLINDKKYALDRLVLASSIPNSVFRNHQDGYDYSNIIWAPNLEIGSPNRNFITKISELSTFIKLEPKIYSTKVEYTFGFLPESAYLSDKNFYLYYYKKSAPSKIFRSKLARAQSSEIKFELIDFESSDIYKIDKIQIDDRPDLAIKINFDQNKETAQKLKYDEFFIKYHVSDIKFENISETTAKVAVTIDGDFKNSLTKNQGKSEFSAKLVFGEPGFAILSKTIKVSLQNQSTQGGSSSPSQNFTLSDNKLILHFDLANLNPKTEYQIADLEIPELAEFFSSGGILDLRAKFTTLYKNVKILGANFDNISEKSAQAIIYFDPTFNSYLNNYKFKAKFKDQDGKIVSYPNEQNNSNNNYPKVENNALKISLSNLVPGHKYTFIGLDPAPNQDPRLTDLSYQYIALNKAESSQSQPEKAPYFYTTTDISAIRTEPKQDEATITISFATKDPNFKSRPNASEKQAILFAKNNATGAIASAISTIKYDANSGNTAEFTLKHLDKLSHYTISEILVDSQLINFNANLKEQKAASRNFYTVANTATVIKIVQYEKTHNKIGLELSFDPLKDTFLENDSIKVLLRKKKNQGASQSVEATGTVGKNLVLKLDFSSNIEAGTEYEIERIIDQTKDKNIQTSVGFAIKKAENYSPSLQNQDSVGRIFSAPELKGFSVTENKNEKVKISLYFEDQEKSLVKINNNSRSLNPNLTLILKNTKTNALVTATGQAKDESSQVKAEFTFSQLDRNVEYVLESINDFTRSDSTIWVNPSWDKKKKAFTVNVDKIEVKDLVYSDIKSTSVKTAIYFDPIKDWYLENKEIEVEIDEDQNPKAVFVAVSSAQSQTHKIQKVSVSKLPDGRLVANLDFTNLKEGSDFKIKSIKLVKKDVATNQENQQTGPKFTIVDEFNKEIVQNKGKKIGEINETAKQKTLKFATDIVISDVEFNTSEQQQSDLERSQTIKVTFANSNNEILRLKNNQTATITLLNTKTQKFIISSATITAQESTDGNKQTTASASFDFKKQLEKLTKYTISSISVIRTNGIYQIPFSATIKSNTAKTSFVTQLNTINVVDVQYSDISPTSVLLTTFFDALEDSSLNDQFEAELEYQLKNQNSGQNIQKTTKVSIQNNQASFLIDKLSEASAYEIKNLVLYKKSGAVRRARALRTRRETSDMIQNLQVVFDNNKVVNAGKKEFATKSLISSIKINPDLIKQKGSNTPIQVGKTNITDTSVGVELQIKDPKKFFADYAQSKPKASQVSQILLMLKSHRTGAIAEASATIEYQENQTLATAKFSFTDLEKYTLYSIVNIFINGVPVGFLNSITEEQKKFHTTANEVLPESFTQLEYHKHGAVVRMVFDVKKNWFLVNNKVKLNFKIQGQNGQQDQALTAEANVQSDGVALFKIDGESIKEKVPSGTRFEISDLVLIPEYNNNQAILQHFPLEKYGSSDKVQVISQAATEVLQSSPLRQKRNLLSLFESNDSPKAKLSQFSNSSLFADTQTNNFAKIGLKLAPLSDTSSKTTPKTFDTAAYVVSVTKQSLAGNTAEISIKINSTYLLDKLNKSNSSLQLKYIDISSGATKTAQLSKKSNSGQNGISSEWVFRAQNLKPLDYYQLVSITQTDNGQQQVINFDDDKVSFQDKLFRTTPNSYSVVDIQRTLLDEKQNKAYVKLQLDEQAKTYLEGYKVRLTYKRQDPINANAVQEAQAESVIKSDGSVDFILEDKSVAGKKKTFQLPVAAHSLSINQSTNTLNSSIQDSELIQSSNFENKSKNVDQSKLFEGFSYQIQKLEIIGKPGSSSTRKKRSTSASSLIDYNISFNASATFQSKDSKSIEEKKIIQGIPITIYDQLISVTEKEFSSGVDTKIYAYFISSEKLSAEDQDKQHFKVQLYNKSLAKYETIIQAENIQKLQAQNGQSNFYLVTFSANLNKASLYDIVKYTYQGKEIKKSEYKTNNVNNTEFITPASKVKLTNFAQVPIYEDTKASAYFQFDEKDEFLWRTKQKIDITLKNAAKSQETKILTITPTGAFSQVELTGNNGSQLEPNTKYELVSYKLNEQTIKTPMELPNRKNQNLKIALLSSSVQLQNHKNKIQKVNLSKEDIIQKTPANLSIETKARYTFNDSNFTQRGFDNNNGKTGKITINLNKELSQIPKAFGEITISKTSPKSNSESITLSSTQAFDPNSGSLEFMVRNLERFQEYKLTSVKLNGVEIQSSSVNNQNTFTPKPTEILVEDITWGSQTVSSSSTSQQNATVSQSVTINFSKDDTWLDNNQILVTPVKVGGTPEQSQLQGKSASISKNKASVQLDNLAPGEEYTLKLELNASKRKKRSLNPSIPIKIPEKQYNQDWTPKIAKTFITPPVIKKVSFTPPKDKDSAASLTVDLLGSKLPKNHPILLTYKPKQVPQSLHNIISSSPTTVSPEQNQLEQNKLVYNLPHLVPIDYTLLNFKVLDSELKFNNDSAKQISGSSSSSSLTKMEFSPPIPDPASEIIITPEPRSDSASKQSFILTAPLTSQYKLAENNNLQVEFNPDMSASKSSKPPQKFTKIVQNWTPNKQNNTITAKIEVNEQESSSPKVKVQPGQVFKLQLQNSSPSLQTEQPIYYVPNTLPSVSAILKTNVRLEDWQTQLYSFEYWVTVYDPNSALVNLDLKSANSLVPFKEKVDTSQNPGPSYYPIPKLGDLSQTQANILKENLAAQFAPSVSARASDYIKALKPNNESMLQEEANKLKTEADKTWQKKVQKLEKHISPKTPRIRHVSRTFITQSDSVFKFKLVGTLSEIFAWNPKKVELTYKIFPSLSSTAIKTEEIQQSSSLSSSSSSSPPLKVLNLFKPYDKIKLSAQKPPDNELPYLNALDGGDFLGQFEGTYFIPPASPSSKPSQPSTLVPRWSPLQLEPKLGENIKNEKYWSNYIYYQDAKFWENRGQNRGMNEGFEFFKYQTQELQRFKKYVFLGPRKIKPSKPKPNLESKANSEAKQYAQNQKELWIEKYEYIKTENKLKLTLQNPGKDNKVIIVQVADPVSYYVEINSPLGYMQTLKLSDLHFEGNSLILSVSLPNNENWNPEGIQSAIPWIVNRVYAKWESDSKQAKNVKHNHNLVKINPSEKYTIAPKPGLAPFIFYT
ncbi:hypothetical protein [Mesomycoplasma flocculare]|uniref:hypothetical protein n=1 Tax=Mesomycoplasma flocculare TaxID=2128 RepID=UPI0002D08470|nr:hypothetical protein [Mesomycoplasma flocculare]ENX51135.1 hypothetical protein MFC_01277 [Mesomycoplasma flocculare ATCC 27716]